MSLTVAELTATLDLDEDPFDRALKRMDAKVGDLGQRMSRAGDRMSIGFTLPIAAAFTKLTGDASDLNETVSQSEQIFGTATSRIGTFAQTAAQRLGQSERAAREAANTFGLFFTNAGKSKAEAADMSIELTKLASDMASFKNTSPERAVEALGAALRGESEPIRTYGVMLDDATLKQRAMSMGLTDTTTGVLPPAIKMQAAYAEILAQTSTIQGDFERTSDGVANKQRIMAAELENTSAKLGEQLIPYAIRGAEVATTLVEAFGSLPPELQTAVLGFAALLAAAGPLLSVGGRLVTNWHTVADTFTTVKDRALGLGIQLGVLYGAVQLLGDTADHADLSKLENDLLNLARTGKTSGEVVGTFGEDLDKLGRAVERVAAPSGLTQAENVVTSLGRALGKTDDDLSEARARIDDLDEALASLAGRDPDAAAAALRAIKEGLSPEAGERLVGLLDKYGGTLAQVDTAQQTTGASAEAMGDDLGQLPPTIDKAAEAFEKLLDATLAQFDSNLGYRQSIDGVESALEALAEKQKDGKATAEDLDDALMDVEGAMLSQAASALRLASDQAEANGSTLTAAEKAAIYRAELVRLADGLAPDSPLRSQLMGYIGNLDAVPETVSTTVLADTSGAFTSVREFLDYLGTIGATSVTTHTSMLQFKQDRHRAKGGPVMPGLDYLVGEEGPELVQFSGAGHVFDAGTTRQMMAAPSMASAGSSAPASGDLVGELRALRGDFADLASQVKRMRAVNVSVDGLTDRTAAQLGARAGAMISTAERY